MKIRYIKREDADKIGGMAKDFANYLHALGDNTNFQFISKRFLRDGFGRNRAFNDFIAEVNSKTAGYLLYYEGYDTDRGTRIIYIADLYVRPEYRQQGVGKALIEKLRAISKQMGVNKLVWTLYANNHIARKFYWHIGARYTADTLLMKLNIH